MDILELKKLMDLSKRKYLYLEIFKKFKLFSDLKNVYYKAYEIKEGLIPVIFIAKSLDTKTVKSVKVFTAAQHNEYNGLFGILEFLKEFNEGLTDIEDILIENQILIFFPLLNPYGFLHPKRDNKSGYFLENGTNLNRFWRKTFVPEYNDLQLALNNYEPPMQTQIIKTILDNYWKNENIGIYIMDFHETSLMDRFINQLSLSLNQESYTFKFTHWLQEKIILNIIELYDLMKYRHNLTPQNLFFKCNPSANHRHLNLTMKEINLIYEKLLDYIIENSKKLPFYFCYNSKSKEYCEKLAQIIYHKLEEILWETRSTAFPHDFHDHGCFVNMNKAAKRQKLYAIELESSKQFFNIFREIERSKSDADYLEKKLIFINKSIVLVSETIREMIKLF
ncbi:MAG: hypothetical protein ACFFDX_00195 [Candidatus Odinarchaeota archaeon]